VKSKDKYLNRKADSLDELHPSYDGIARMELQEMLSIDAEGEIIDMALNQDGFALSLH